MDEVGTDGVAPMHIAPVPTKRIMLIEKMILAVGIHKTVRIVVPAASRGEVELRTKLFVVKVFGAFDLLALLDGFQTLRVFGQKIRVDDYFFSREGGKIEEHPEIRLGVRQLDLEFAFGAPIHQQAEAAFG